MNAGFTLEDFFVPRTIRVHVPALAFPCRWRGFEPTDRRRSYRTTAALTARRDFGGLLDHEVAVSFSRSAFRATTNFSLWIKVHGMP